MRHTDAFDLLAEASGILASSFTLSETLPQIAALCVREFADYCAIWVRGAGSGGELIEAAGAARLRVGPRPPEELQAALRERGLETIVAAPLCGRDEVLGTFALAARRAHAFNEATQKLAAILTLLVANAVDQAALFERTHRVADRLQRALLPESLPALPDVRFHGAYRPASGESEVGGDWYDAFVLPDGRVAISVGDVAGHGLEAAAIMGEIRQAMRSAAVGDLTPAGVLEQINGVISLRASIGMVSAIFGYYDPPARALTYAVAGHPPPIVTLADGSSAFLAGGGMPLGVGTSVDATDWTITIPPLASVTLYTDGMTEYEHDVLAGERALLAAAAQPAVRAAANPAAALQERIFSSLPNRDDAAALVLVSHDQTIPATMAFSAIPTIAPLARSAMHRLADHCGLSDERRFALVLGVGEALANAIEHAYRKKDGIVYISTFITPGALTVEIEDRGDWKPFVPREERGRGIALMHELFDGVRIATEQGKTCVRLTLSRERLTG